MVHHCFNRFHKYDLGISLTFPSHIHEVCWCNDGPCEVRAQELVASGTWIWFRVHYFLQLGNHNFRFSAASVIDAWFSDRDGGEQEDISDHGDGNTCLGYIHIYIPRNCIFRNAMGGPSVLIFSSFISSLLGRSRPVQVRQTCRAGWRLCSPVRRNCISVGAKRVKLLSPKIRRNKIWKRCQAQEVGRVGAREVGWGR